jgi:hypothetical protein
MKATIALASCAVLLAVSSASSALPWPQGTAPATKSGGLHATISQFKSFEKCVEDLTRELPAEMASQVLGTDQVELICHSRQAAAKDDASVCQRDIKDYNQRSQCQRFFAIYVGRPLDCPQRGWPSYREGLCQALSSRNPALCLAVPAAQRTLCNAVLRGTTQCNSLPAAQRPQCLKEAAAWKGIIKPLPATLSSTFKPQLDVRATALTSTLTLSSDAQQFKSKILDTGILLADQSGTGDWLVIDRNFAPQEAYDYSNQPPMDLELAVPLPSIGTVGTISIGGATGGTAKVSFRESGTYRSRNFQASSGSVTISKLSRTTAGQVAGTFTLELTDGVDKLKLDGSFETFIRELLPLSRVASYSNYRTSSSNNYSWQGTLSPDDVKKAQARIVKVKDNIYTVDPSIRADIISDTGKLTNAASISRRYQTGGTYRGFQLYSVYQNSLLWLLGFRDHDTILKINGKAMDTKEDFYDAFAKLKKSAQIVVTLERSSNEMKLTFNIRKVPPPKTPKVAK